MIFALRELVRRRRLEDLKSLMGAVDLQIDLPASRRRPRGNVKSRKSSRRGA